MVTRKAPKIASVSIACGMLYAGPAAAQTITTQVFDGVVPFSYDRGRNVSVTQRARPEYSPLGIRVGAFELKPAVDVALGYHDNVYQSDVIRVDDAFAVVAPRVALESDWAAHSVRVDASSRFVRYFEQTERNEDGWSVGAEGRVEASSDIALNIGARTSRLYETQFSGAAITNVRSAVPVQASIVKGMAEFDFNRLRVAVASDFSDFNYRPVRTIGGADLSQRSRSRQIVRGTGHIEYGLTPDAGLFVQGTYSTTDYDTPLAPRVANRNANEVRVLAGASFDLSALVRGSIGLGYIDRDYASAVYRDVSGLGFDAKVEYFFSPLTTFTLTARRGVEDSSFGGSGGFVATGAAARIDHELLRNLILNVGAEYEHDDYRGIEGKGTLLRAAGGARYMMSGLVSLNADVQYGRRTSDTALNGPKFDEFRATIGVSIHP